MSMSMRMEEVLESHGYCHHMSPSSSCCCCCSSRRCGNNNQSNSSSSSRRRRRNNRGSSQKVAAVIYVPVSPNLDDCDSGPEEEEEEQQQQQEEEYAAKYSLCRARARRTRTQTQTHDHDHGHGRVTYVDGSRTYYAKGKAHPHPHPQRESDTTEIWHCVQGLADRMTAMEFGIRELLFHNRKTATASSATMMPRKSSPFSFSCSRRLFPRSTSSMSEDTAAVVIQRRFRAFLARRSLTLRGLQNLAVVKTGFYELKQLLKHRNFCRFLACCPEDRLALSEKAAALLFKLESIQGTDSMLRNAQMCLHKQMVALIEYLDNIDVNESYCGMNRKKNQESKFETDVDIRKERSMMSNQCHNYGLKQHGTSSVSFFPGEDTEQDTAEEVEFLGRRPWNCRSSGAGMEYPTTSTILRNMNSRRATKSDMASNTKSIGREGKSSFCVFPEVDEQAVDDEPIHPVLS